MKDNLFPIVVATWPQGIHVVKRAGQILRYGGSLLDAVEKGINVTELDPNEMSVGYGGLPNEAGIVEVDAAIMDGRMHTAGSVMGLRRIKTPISVARRVMERTKHVNLVGEGALMFAVKEGFREENMFTEQNLRAWEKWLAAKRTPHHWSHDTMGAVARDSRGDLAVGCSTSGTGFKIAGRVGDSPIVGSGLYVDNDVGGAVATGFGEEILKVCSSFLVVELMRQGRTPQEACEGATQRLLDKTRVKPLPICAVIALNKHGEYGGASSVKGFAYAVWTPKSARVFKAKFLA